MTLRMICIGLCIANLVFVGVIIAQAFFNKYLINQCSRYETRNERNTELLINLNSVNDELKRDNNDLRKEIKELKKR